MGRSSLTPSALLVVVLLSLTDSLSATGASEDTDSEPSSTSTVRAEVGKTAWLTCHLPNNGDHDVVSWARQHMDNLIVTHPRRMNARSFRMDAACSKRDDSCLLAISNVQKSDSGLYLCMVSSEPSIRRSVYLTVFEPTVTILGEPFRTHWQGSTINLTCVIQDGRGPGDSVEWMHDDSVIQPFLDFRRTIYTALDTSIVKSTHLIIWDAQPEDSGTYTCRLYGDKGGSSDSVDVEVMEVVRDDFHPAVSGAQGPLTAVLLVVAAAAAAAASAGHCC